MYIIFDTETTGFFNKRDPRLENQPYIVQFWGIVATVENNKCTEISRIDQLIKPRVSIPFEASRIHHIYDVDVKDAPYIEDKMDNFLSIMNEVDYFVGHNLEFDEEMLRIELRRMGREADYPVKQVLDTMKSTVDLCKLEWNGARFKYPKLWELHKFLFWEYFTWAHNAMMDVEATMRCFEALLEKNIFLLEKQENKVLSLF